MCGQFSTAAKSSAWAGRTASPLSRGREEWAKLLKAVGVPCAPIATVAQALGSPEARVRSTMTESDHPTIGRLRTTGSPFKLSGTPVTMRTAAPPRSVSTPTRFSPRPVTRPMRSPRCTPRERFDDRLGGRRPAPARSRGHSPSGDGSGDRRDQGPSSCGRAAVRPCGRAGCRAVGGLGTRSGPDHLGVSRKGRAPTARVRVRSRVFPSSWLG
ncbi:CoA transferase [Streptomyces sp. SudanB182_2057]|uniref:CoA transferase n=1 Tax=Streptomyces sp. SudanB182_2057 TaxID=3035281 RepID=UPI003F54620A